MMAVAGDIPVMGIRSAKAAMLGIVYSKPEAVISGR